ncbi:uncharacterized protein FIBRA_01291 [Fibroporia radiculosa]|uniref:Septation initiation network scaffold protein cdc11 n=1 Tax=Fibroporia radiculosa TaxID=599839 RepID=J4I8E6_9APHY|nr:uncharacterized protein FIBRA_01291 [Fibroporia radiculosa]CCL99276.1 predicted protein [Fibroporia radiculosa]
MDAGALALKPAWQTEDLEDEWIDQEEDDSQAEVSFHAPTTSDISFTQPYGSVLVRNSDFESGTPHRSSEAGGTFLVRDDVSPASLLPKTPGRNKPVFGKSFFSPLALEKMFEPPSPPHASSTAIPTVQTSAPPVRSRLSQVYVPSEDDTELVGGYAESVGFEDRSQDDLSLSDGGGPAINCQFTFEVPRPSPFDPMGSIPNAQSTPGPPRVSSIPLHPPTDPRLRLFQFQYDTFTREHLSAMVDSIAVNTPGSGGSGSAPPTEEPSPTGLSPVRESSTSRLRSAKRIKLSPASDFAERDGGAIVIRPNTLRKDYVGESRSLMEKIRQARDFSTISTTASAQSPAPAEKLSSPQDQLNVPAVRRPSLLGAGSQPATRASSSSWTVASSQRGIYSSLGYRQQAANLMAQIRNDMKGSKRLFSGDTEMSHVTHGEKNHSVMDEDEERTASFSMHGAASGEMAPMSVRSQARSSSRQYGTVRDRPKSSPRRSQRMPSAPHVTERELTEDLSQLSMSSERLLEQFPEPPVVVGITTTAASFAADTDQAPELNPTLLVPAPGNGPAYPSSSLRSGRNEDLTRFVSSSTASGTTLTTGSTASFVKHPGPKQITRITPEDVPTLPDRVGKMVFDKVMMRWVKATALATEVLHEEDEREPPVAVDGNDSEDPFRDIESLREDDSRNIPIVTIERANDDDDDDGLSMDAEKRKIEDIGDSEVEDEEEAELTSFSFDGPSAELVELVSPEGQAELDDTDSEEDEEDTETTGLSVDTALASDDSEDSYEIVAPTASPPEFEPALQDSPLVFAPPYGPTSLSTPNPPPRASFSATPTPAVRSALKSTSITPVSALKDPSKTRNYTPANKLGHRRSVSFSDGRRDGPILGIGRNAPTPDGTETEGDRLLVGGPSKASSALVPSARSKRIIDMLDNLGDADFAEESPSKASSSGRPASDELHPLKPRRPSSATVNARSPSREISRRVFSRSHSSRTPASTSRHANATFLTECSFGVAHDRLVQVITDVQPFEPYWEDLASIDLSKRNIDSVARLKEFLPRLDSLTLNDNHLSWLSGVPGTVRSLSVAANVLTGLTSFSHLLNLENLDISRNEIESLRQLECLRHLRELRADGNKIDSTDGLQKMDGLVKLSLQGNKIRSLDLRQYRWTRLEMLNLSRNRLGTVAGLATLPALIALNLDHNVLGELDPQGPMPRLRILRASSNRLEELDASPYPNLRTLYADNNSLGAVHKAYRLTKLENLSLRNQNGRAGLSLSIRDVRDVKRLYLSGNPLQAGFISEPCYNLVYLELAACRLNALPADLARLVPNVRVLNLNYNFLADARALEGLARLRKLTLIGSRITATKGLVRMLRGMRDVEMLDFRCVPLPLPLPLPLFLPLPFPLPSCACSRPRPLCGLLASGHARSFPARRPTRPGAAQCRARGCRAQRLHGGRPPGARALCMDARRHAAPGLICLRGALGTGA